MKAINLWVTKLEKAIEEDEGEQARRYIDRIKEALERIEDEDVKETAEQLLEDLEEHMGSWTIWDNDEAGKVVAELAEVLKEEKPVRQRILTDDDARVLAQAALDHPKTAIATAVGLATLVGLAIFNAK